jgi:hypothetical protein
VRSPDVSAQTGGRASADIKEIGAAVDPGGMRGDEAAGGGRGGARGPGWPRVRWRRPTGIRNGGLLLVLVALAALMGLVDQPPGPGQRWHPPGIAQHLPPPAGITGTPPTGAQPPGNGPVRDGERPLAADRAHPRRAHPRPDRPGTVTGRSESALTPSGGQVGAAGPGSGAGGSGSGGGGSAGGGPLSPPPVTTAPVEVDPPVRVRVPPVRVRVTPPTVAGREPPAVDVETPEVSVDLSGTLRPLRLLGD